MMIHALPGMGADQRMYPEPWSSLPNFSAHDWPVYSGRHSIHEIAEAVCTLWNVGDGDVLVGSSLGGMVACELTKMRRIPVVYLVGSALKKEEVNGLLRLLHPLAQYAPLELLQRSAGKIPTELAQMFAGVDPEFIRASCAAIFQWEGGVGEGTRVVRLHGLRDPVIPPPAVADLWVDGGHLIALTHAGECATFVGADLGAR